MYNRTHMRKSVIMRRTKATYFEIWKTRLRKMKLSEAGIMIYYNEMKNDQIYFVHLKKYIILIKVIIINCYIILILFFFLLLLLLLKLLLLLYYNITLIDWLIQKFLFALWFSSVNSIEREVTCHSMQPENLDSIHSKFSLSYIIAFTCFSWI